MHTFYCTYLHLQKGKISSEVWTKSDNHRDCAVLRPRSISLVIVWVCRLVSQEKERERETVHIHEGELPSGANQWLYCHWSSSILYHSLSPSPYEEKGWMKTNKLEKMWLRRLNKTLRNDLKYIQTSFLYLLERVEKWRQK